MSQLKQNTTDLDILIAKANALPEYNAVSDVEQATPTISVSSGGLITASATQEEGYVNAGTKSATKQLTTKAAATITPSTSNQTIAANTFLTGVQTILGDADLIATNIRSGKSIFGVNGSMQEGLSGFANFYNFTKAASGSVTLSTRQGTYKVTHSMGIMPKLLMIYTEDAPRTNSSSLYSMQGLICFQTCSNTTLSGTLDGIFMLLAVEKASKTSGERIFYRAAIPKGSASSYSNVTGTMTNTTLSTSIPVIANSSTFSILDLGGLYGSSTYKWLVMG